MQLTDEQQAIIAHQGHVKINAVAGSGKTTTLLEYAQSRPKNERILYIAFNKSVRLEAERKFAERQLYNVKVETAHSLAYKQLNVGQRYQLQSYGYKTHELVDILKLEPLQNTPNTEYILANHIRNFVAYFCNSTARKVQEINYLDIISDEKAKAFANNFYADILYNTRLFLAKMYKGETPITHDFYLKQFQLTNPTLPYKYILFDEGQDASPVMLDVFLKQNATKVIVGDTHQQIYGWRHAINSLEQVDFPALSLNTSFRFDPEIAWLAGRFLDLKKMFKPHDTLHIKGVGNTKNKKEQATLARTNLSLLVSAIEQTDSQGVGNIYFEGNINSYTYAEEGASIYDVLNLYQKKGGKIRDKLIKSMKDFSALEDYVEKTEDGEMRMLVDIVKKYKTELPYLIKGLKNKHVPNEDKHKADMIFSTVHRCKGMEYDEVTLANDFTTEDKIKKILAEAKEKKQALPIDKLSEEVNVLYVAATRTRNQLNVPAGLMPKNRKINLVYSTSNKKSSFTGDGDLSFVPTGNKYDKWKYNKKRSKWADYENDDDDFWEFNF